MEVLLLRWLHLPGPPPRILCHEDLVRAVAKCVSLGAVCSPHLWAGSCAPCWVTAAACWGHH